MSGCPGFVRFAGGCHATTHFVSASYLTKFLPASAPRIAAILWRSRFAAISRESALREPLSAHLGDLRKIQAAIRLACWLAWKRPHIVGDLVGDTAQFTQLGGLPAPGASSSFPATQQRT